jgi:hypothetical protein
VDVEALLEHIRSSNNAHSPEVSMTPTSPVLPASGAVEVIYAKDQPEYEPLPTFRTEKSVLSRWTLTEAERRYIAAGGDLFICMMNFSGPLLPILPIAADPDTALQIMLEAEAAL